MARERCDWIAKGHFEPVVDRLRMPFLRLEGRPHLSRCQMSIAVWQNDLHLVTNVALHTDEHCLGRRIDRKVRYFRMAVCLAAFLDLGKLSLRSVKDDRHFDENKRIGLANSCTRMGSVDRIDAKTAVETYFVCTTVPAIMIDVSIQLGWPTNDFAKYFYVTVSVM